MVGVRRRRSLANPARGGGEVTDARSNIKNAKNFLFDLGNPYKEVLVDNSGVKSIELGAIGVPETYLLKDNKIIKKFIGPLNKITFDEITEIIK